MSLDIIEYNNSAFEDKRGLYWTSWEKNKYPKNFKHDKFSLSKKKCFKRASWR